MELLSITLDATENLLVSSSLPASVTPSIPEFMQLFFTVSVVSCLVYAVPFLASYAIGHAVNLIMGISRDSDI